MTAISEPFGLPRLSRFAQGLDSVLSEPGRVDLVFQPIVDLSRGVLAGYESLTRIESEFRAPPNEWFSAADELGLAAELEALVIDRALRARERLPPNCFLSVNLGPQAACSEPVRRVFERAGSLAGLVVEITEQSAVEDYDRLNAALAPVREAGASLAVDDAGAGFASLRHVTELRPDFVKVDRQLVANLDQDPANAAIVEMLGVLAGRLDAWIIAEGVERRAELSRLMELGVPLAQGYGLARPAPQMDGLAGETEALLSGLRRHRADGRIGLLQEPCPTIAQDATRGAIAELFVLEATATVVALVDEYARPVALLARGAFLAGEQALPVSLRVQPISDLAEVARRAVNRPVRQRFEPLACCDDCGRMIGVVRVERLIEALAR